MPHINEPTIQELFSLRGRTCLITGATGHLGSTMAAALAEAGASVIASSRRVNDARGVIEKLVCNEDARHYAIELDHMDENSIIRGFDQAVADAGRVDVLINNGHEVLGADWTTVTSEQFSRQLANATGYFLLARALRNHAVARGGGGVVVMVGSMYGVVGSYPAVYEDLCTASPAAYHALKGGIVHLTRHLAVYWAGDNVRVNCLSPGPFPGAHCPPELIDRLNKKVPMRRVGQPTELKGSIVFLSSEASSYMTGQNLVIDGGWTAW